MATREGTPTKVGESSASLLKAAGVTLGVVAGLFALFYAAAFLTATLLRIPSQLALPPAARWLGGGVLVASFAIALWVFLYRNPADMLRSTSATFSKLFGWAKIGRRSGRTEPLVIAGPQRYVRQPLYLSVILAVLGWGLAIDSSVTLIEVVPFVLWFVLLQIPFEERELDALFGEQFREYRDSTPMLFPFPRTRG